MEIIADLGKVVLTSIGSIIVMFLLTKLIGNKQVSQLNMFDYINGITIGSIAAEMATSLEDFLLPLLAMTIYGVTGFLLSLLSSKSIKARRFINGRSVILYDSGKLYYDNFKLSKIDLNEFLTQCRVNGYFDLCEIQTAVLESNGNISILPAAAHRPLTPADMDMQPDTAKISVNVILSGQIIEENLRRTGNDRKWLDRQLRSNGVKNPAEVYLASVGSDNSLSVYPFIRNKDKNPKNDFFQ